MQVVTVCLLLLLFIVSGVFLEQTEPTPLTLEASHTSSQDSDESLSSDEVPIVNEEIQETSGFLQILLDILPLDAYAAKILSQVQNSTAEANASTKHNETSTPKPTQTTELPHNHPSDPNIIYGIPDTSIPSTLEAATLPPSSPLSQLTNMRDKFNYASMDCGANVLSVNREAKDATSILVSSKDRYMLNPCGVSKRFVVLELCEEIGIQIIAIANYEFFSSMLKGFQVFGTNRYPAQQWTPIGNFTAQNARRLQYFVLPEPLWFKYIRIQFDTYYGDEYYCPISELRVHGTTVVDDITLQIERDTREISELANALRSPLRVYQPPVQPDIKVISNYHPPIHRHAPEIDDDEDDPIDSSKDWNSFFSDSGDLLKGLEDTFKQSFQRIRTGIEENFYNHEDEEHVTDDEYACECDPEDANCECALEYDTEEAKPEPSDTNFPERVLLPPDTPPTPLNPTPTTENHAASLHNDEDENVDTITQPTTDDNTAAPISGEKPSEDLQILPAEEHHTDTRTSDVPPSDTLSQTIISIEPPSSIEPPFLDHPQSIDETKTDNNHEDSNTVTPTDESPQNSPADATIVPPTPTSSTDNPNDHSEDTTFEQPPPESPPTSESIDTEDSIEKHAEEESKTTVNVNDPSVESSTESNKPEHVENEGPSSNGEEHTTPTHEAPITNNDKSDDNEANTQPTTSDTTNTLIGQCNSNTIPITFQSPIELRDDVCYANLTALTLQQVTPHPCKIEPQKTSPTSTLSTPLQEEHPTPTEPPTPPNTDPPPPKRVRKRPRPTSEHESEPISTYSNLGIALGSTPQNIFKTLINRIKTLEINQSIAAVYLADLTTFYGEAFSKMSHMFARLETANSNLLDLVHNSSKKLLAKQKHLTEEVEELRAERIHMLSNISVLAREVRILSETTLLLKTQQDTQQWINIFTAGALGALLVCVIWRPTGNIHNSYNNNTTNNSTKNNKNKPASPPPTMKLSRSVGTGMNLLVNPDLERLTPKQRRRRHSIGHSLSPSWRTRKQQLLLSLQDDDDDDDTGYHSDSNSDWEMDADDEISNKYFKNEGKGEDESLSASAPTKLPTEPKTRGGGGVGLTERVFPYLMRKSASTSTMDSEYHPQQRSDNLLRFLFM